MDPSAWREMVDRSRELDLALGSEEKFIADNEKQTAILQRRALRVNRNINAGEKIISQYIESLRPCPEDGIPPYELNNIVEKRINRNLLEGDYIKWADLS
jgi:N-acetylneuraminate synthase